MNKKIVAIAGNINNNYLKIEKIVEDSMRIYQKFPLKILSKTKCQDLQNIIEKTAKKYNLNLVKENEVQYDGIQIIGGNEETLKQYNKIKNLNQERVRTNIKPIYIVPIKSVKGLSEIIEADNELKNTMPEYDVLAGSVAAQYLSYKIFKGGKNE